MEVVENGLMNAILASRSSDLNLCFLFFSSLGGMTACALLSATDLQGVATVDDVLTALVIGGRRVGSFHTAGW